MSPILCTVYTQLEPMTIVLLGKDLVLEGLSLKIDDKKVPGIMRMRLLIYHNIPTNPTVWTHCATLGYNGHMFNPNNRCENRGFYAKNVVTCHDTSLGSQRNYCILSHFSMPLHATTCNVLAAYYTNPAAFHSFLPPNRPHVFLSSCTPSSQRFLF